MAGTYLEDVYFFLPRGGHALVLDGGTSVLKACSESWCLTTPFSLVSDILNVPPLTHLGPHAVKYSPLRSPRVQVVQPGQRPSQIGEAQPAASRPRRYAYELISYSTMSPFVCQLDVLIFPRIATGLCRQAQTRGDKAGE